MNVSKLKPNQWRWIVVDDVMLTVGTSGSMPDDDWKKCVEDLEAKRVTRWVGWMLDTFDVNSVQRKLGIDAILRNKVRLAVLSDDRVVRGLVTAAAWFGVDVKPFPPKDLPMALKHLNISRPLDTAVTAAFKEIVAEFGY